MNRREIAHVVVGLALGGLVASAAWSLERKAPPPKAGPEAADAGGDDIESLRKANANLVESLHEADKTIAMLREQAGAPAPAPAASASAARPEERDAGGFRRRARGEPTQEDWERMAQLGSVRVRMPCLRDKPWTPSTRTLDRLGLAPQDATVIRDAYEHSNKRMADQIKPLCAKVLGSAEAADRVGPKACSDAILSGAKRADPEGTQKSIVRVAEANAGKGDGKAADAPVEQLLLAMTKETKLFEAELAQKLGPEEAKRIAWAPELCADRTVARGTDRDETEDDASSPRRR